jgi:multidrug efflux pump subunit AcrB
VMMVLRAEHTSAGQIADITQGLGPAQISHFDGELVVNVEANTSDESLGQVMKAIMARVNKLTLPPAFTSRRAEKWTARTKCSGESSLRSASR